MITQTTTRIDVPYEHYLKVDKHIEHCLQEKEARAIIAKGYGKQKEWPLPLLLCYSAVTLLRVMWAIGTGNAKDGTRVFELGVVDDSAWRQVRVYLTKPGMPLQRLLPSSRCWEVARNTQGLCVLDVPQEIREQMAYHNLRMYVDLVEPSCVLQEQTISNALVDESATLVEHRRRTDRHSPQTDLEIVAYRCRYYNKRGLQRLQKYMDSGHKSTE